MFDEDEKEKSPRTVENRRSSSSSNKSQRSSKNGTSNDGDVLTLRQLTLAILKDETAAKFFRAFLQKRSCINYMEFACKKIEFDTTFFKESVEQNVSNFKNIIETHFTCDSSDSFYIEIEPKTLKKLT